MVLCTCRIWGVVYILYYVHDGYAVLCAYCDVAMFGMWCCVDMVLCTCCICSTMYIWCCVHDCTCGAMYIWCCVHDCTCGVVCMSCHAHVVYGYSYACIGGKRRIVMVIVNIAMSYLIKLHGEYVFFSAVCWLQVSLNTKDGVPPRGRVL